MDSHLSSVCPRRLVQHNGRMMIGCVSASAPARLSLVGDHLDWLDGRAITFGSDSVRFRVNVSPEGTPGPLSKAVWAVLSAEVGRYFAPDVALVPAPPEWLAGGLGSSGAVAVAAIRAASKLKGVPLTREANARLAIAVEERLGVATGQMDQYTAALGGFRSFLFAGTRIQSSRTLTAPVQLQAVVIDSGQQRRSGEIVRRLQHEAGVGSERLDRFRRTGRELHLEMEEELVKTNPDLLHLGRLVNRAQTELELIGVSSPQLDSIIAKARWAGAHGAKLLGAGGGGSVLAICDLDAAPRIVSRLATQGIRAYPVVHTSLGVE